MTVLPVVLLSACAVEPGMHMNLAHDAARDGGIATQAYEGGLAVSMHRIVAASPDQPRNVPASREAAASVPIGPIDGEVLGLDTLMKRADRALYAAKAAGRDRVERWHPALDGEVKR